MRQKSQKYAENITKRGKVKPSLVGLERAISTSPLTGRPTPALQKKDPASSYPAGPILLGFLIFVVIGSGTRRPLHPHLVSSRSAILALFQLFRAQLFW